MSPEQKELFDKLTRLQQRVAINVIAGMSQRQAYMNAGGKAESDTSADTSASEIMNNPKVVAFVDAMKEEALSAAIMTRREAMERLTGFARTDLKDLVEFGSYELGEDEEGNAIVQAAWKIKPSALQDPVKMASIAELSTGKDGIKIKTHSPLAAIQQLAKMQGWESASKHEHSGPNGGPIQSLDVTPDALKEELAKLGYGRETNQLIGKLHEAD